MSDNTQQRLVQTTQFLLPVAQQPIAEACVDGSKVRLRTAEQRQEILDWYHLNENLQKVGASIKRLRQAEADLTPASS